MATDEERLLVRIEAQLRQFEKAMAQATGGADRAAKRIESRFGAMERRLENVGRGLVRSFVGPLAALASAREIGQAVDAFVRIENSLKVAGLQGEELKGVFDRLFSAAQKNAAPVESLAELYGRAALVQKELGVSSEELLRFTEGVAAALRVSGKSAQESSGALLQLAQALGSGTVRAEEFNSILEGALPIAQAAARGLEEAGGSVAKLRQLVIDGKVSSEAFFRAFEAGQGTIEALAETTEFTLGQAMTRVQNSFIRLIGTIDQSTNASTALKGALGLLADGFDALPGLVDSFRSSLERLNQQNALLDFFITTEREAEEFAARLQELQERARSGATTAIEPSGKGGGGWGGIAAEASEAATASENASARIAAAFEAVQTVSLRDFKGPAKTAGGGAGGSRKSPGEQFEEDIRRIQERTAALEVETAAVGRSTFEAEKMLAVQALLNEAKRAGLAITPELTAQIEQEATAYATASAELEKTEERYRGLQEAQSFFAETAFDAFSEFIPVIETGNKALDGLINRLIEAALQATLLGQGPLAGLLGAGGGAGGGLLGKLFGGFFASGGVLGAGKWGIAGERGPEIIQGPARVTPAGGVSVQVIDQSRRVAPVETKTEEGVGPGGVRQLRVLIQDVVTGMAKTNAGRQIGLGFATVRR